MSATVLNLQLENALEGNSRNIAVIGAGYGGVTAALRLAHLFRHMPDYRIHLIDRNPYHTLKTQLHEAAVHRTEVTIDIGRLIRKYHITFHLGVVTALDLSGRLVTVSGQSLPFEYLVLALGSKTNFYNIPGLDRYALTLQSAADAARIHEHIAAMCALASSEKEERQRREMLRFVIGGGGLTGIELAGELIESLQQTVRNYRIPSGDVEVVIVEAAQEILQGSEPGLRKRIEDRLVEKRVKVLTATRVTGVSGNEVSLSTGETLRTRTLVWTGGIRVSGMAESSGMAIGVSGRIRVNSFLQSVTSPRVYAIGDNALAINPRTGQPVPAAAQFALQQGRLVAENIRANVLGKPEREYLPRVWGEVISLGRHLAAGWVALPLLRKLSFAGFLASLLKTAIREKHIVLLTRESRNWIGY